MLYPVPSTWGGLTTYHESSSRTVSARTDTIRFTPVYSQATCHNSFSANDRAFSTTQFRDRLQ